MMKSKILLVLFVILSLFIAGCSNENPSERSYNQAKQTYQELREEDARLQLVVGEAPKYIEGEWTKSTLALNEEALIKREEIAIKMRTAFFQMKMFSTTTMLVYNDFTVMKEDYKQYKAEWPSRLKQAIDLIIAAQKQQE